MHGAEDAAYTRQLSGGFARLRFEQPLEREFRVHYAARNRPLVRIAMVLGLVLVGGMSLMDWQLRPGVFAAGSAAVRLGVMAPLLMLCVLATYPGRLARLTNLLQASTGVVIAGGSLWLLRLASEYAVPADITGVAAATLLLYLMWGLRFLPTLCLTLPLLGGFLLLEGALGQPTAGFAYDSFSLICINLVAAYTCYRMEHSARTIFLEREIVNLLAGTDALTGIPNRKIFNTYLQSVRRQALRESRGMAVALLELDHLEAFRGRYGQQAADVCFRRVAHAITRSARRPLDFVARFSGEIFAIALYDPDQRFVEETIGQVRDNVAALDVPHELSPTAERVTVSIGVAMSPPGCRHDSQHLLESADEALEEARSQGGDAIVVRDNPSATSSRVYIGPWQSSATDSSSS